MIAVDTSALVAILLGEDERDTYLAILDSADGISISTEALIEARIVVHSRGGPSLRQKLDRLCEDYRMNIISLGQEEVEFARHGFATYGKGSGYPAQLNFGGLFAYSLAKSLSLPLLFKGNDFALTGVSSAT